jgi:NTE family protein
MFDHPKSERMNVIYFLLAVFLISGCANNYGPTNQPIDLIDEQSGYRSLSEKRLRGVGNNVVLLAFSGGGTRAAVLSYGVLQELRDTTIVSGKSRVRLLDEVDAISSVSGGSFTAAYYGLFGDQIFETYEQEFLGQSIQSMLVKRLLRPAHWFKALFSGFDRTEMAIDLYDRMVFKGATFADLRRGQHPFIEINATDLAAGLRFPFTQERFDLLCSDLESFSIARAVTASSAVPVAFPSVVLKNHADACEIRNTREWRLLNEGEISGPIQQQFVDGLKSYRDADDRQFIHLVDGGISDNLGLRAMIERIDNVGEEVLNQTGRNPPRSVLFLLVNAETKPDRVIEKTAKKPSVGATVSAFSNAQITRYNLETRDNLLRKVEEYEVLMQKRGWPTRIFFSEVSFEDIPDTEASRFLNNLPTSLELNDDEIEALKATARILLRQDPEFKRFIEHNDGQLTADAMSTEEGCRHFHHVDCAP